MLAFELSVTGLNSYEDTKTNGMQLPFPRKTAKRILIALWVIAVFAAILLVIETGWIVFVCGGLCFLVGVLYSFGPAPISRMPLGEVFSGLFEGFFIPFLVVFINTPADSLIGFSLQNWILQINFNILGLFRLLVLTMPAILGIANIMLANNICDLQADIRVNRYTLPYYIGVQNSLRLFALNYYTAFAFVILTAIFRILPIYVLAVPLTLLVIQKNIVLFQKVQSKTDTFPTSVKNFSILMGALILIAGIAAFTAV